MFSAHAGSASITLHEIDEKISFEVLAHFFKKLALARGECLEKDLTSSDHNIRASALTIQEMITAIDKLVIPTEAELKAFRGY